MATLERRECGYVSVFLLRNRQNRVPMRIECWGKCHVGRWKVDGRLELEYFGPHVHDGVHDIYTGFTLRGESVMQPCSLKNLCELKLFMIRCDLGRGGFGQYVAVLEMFVKIPPVYWRLFREFLTCHGFRDGRPMPRGRGVGLLEAMSANSPVLVDRRQHGFGRGRFVYRNLKHMRGRSFEENA